MEFLKLAGKRCSVRNYKSDEIEDENYENIVKIENKLGQRIIDIANQVGKKLRSW